MVFVLNEHATLAASSNYKLASIGPLSFVLPDFSLGLHRINIESALAHVSSAEKPSFVPRPSLAPVFDRFQAFPDSSF